MQDPRQNHDTAMGGRVRAAVQAAQVRAYAGRAGMVTGASLVVGVLAVAALGAGLPGRHLAWLAALAAVLGLRALVARAWQRAAHDAMPDTGPWLLRLRALTLAHGAVWGALAWVGPAPAGIDGVATLLLMQAGIGIAGMMLVQFDRWAALGFALLAVLPLAARLALMPGPQPRLVTVAAVMLLILTGCLFVVAQRAARERASLAEARLAEADRAQETRQVDTLLQRVFDHVGEGICIFDAESRLLAVNARLAEMVGLDDPALMRPGTPVRAWLLHLGRRGEYGAVDPVAEADRREAELRSPQRGIAQRRRADGRTIETRRTPLPEGGFAMVCVDVTGRVASEAVLFENQRTLDVLLRNTEEGFWFIDNEARTTDANRAMCRMLGVTREQLLGRSIFEFVDAENEAIFRHQVALRAQGQAGSYEITLRRDDGSRLDCYNNATPIHDAQGRKIGAIGLFSDITAQKQAAAEAQRASALLAEKTHVLETTLESLSQGVISVDAATRIHVWNRRALELLQVPQALLQTHPTLRELGRWQAQQGHFGAQLEQLEGPVERDELHRYLAGEDSVLGQAAHYRRTRSDGTVIEVHTHFTPGGGHVRTYTDVTAQLAAQRALRESETRFRSMADAAPALIWLSDPQGAVIWFNQAWLKLRGETPQQAMAAPWAERIHPDDHAGVRAAFESAFARREAYTVEFRAATADGGWAWIADQGIPRFGDLGAFEGFVSYGWNITERKRAEVALIAARDEAERANRAKSEFLSRMSHELRTPLNAILGFGQLLQRDPAEPLQAEQRRRVEQILRGGTHLLELINEVLDLARIEAGTLPLQLEPVDVDALIDECLRLMQPAARARQLRLTLRTAPGAAGTALADPTRLRQVLLNLLSNAIKYNREGGEVRLRCSHAGIGLRLEVEDDGPGLDATRQQRLFQAFERLDAEGSGVEGAGIGLALSKSLVGLMQGRIGIDSAPGAGSCFWVELQCAGAAAQAGAAGETAQLPTAAARPLRVLYIEDNAVNQLLMQGMLAHRPGLALDMAELPEQGLAMARAAPPDLVLLDIQLPGMSGYEVLQALRADARTHAVPVIAVSANAMADDLDQARRAGFDDYLTKPLDLNRLLTTVERVLSTSSPPAP
jgi:PAS domain S-box-containing protein